MGKRMGSVRPRRTVGMKRTLHRLTALGVSEKKKPGLYCDGGGLYLRVTQCGTKSWIYRFRMGARTRDAGLGGYPLVGLSEARSKATVFRQQVANGMDPIEARSKARAKAARETVRVLTFADCARTYIQAHENGWRNPKHRQQWRSTLETYAFPVIGTCPVADLDTDLIMKVLEPIWLEKPETASRVRGRIERILNWAKARGYREGENPGRWRGHLDQLLPAKNKVRQVIHHPAMPYHQISTFVAELRALDGVSVRALEFLILTATRTSETLGASWSEFDLDRRMWTIPPERMKIRKQHRIPLSIRATEIVREMYGTRQNEFVFPGMKLGRPLSQMALAMQLRRMGRSNVTVHGFRSTFRDWVSDCTDFQDHVAEMALAHSAQSNVVAAYRRGDVFEKRRALMDAWDAFTNNTAKRKRVRNQGRIANKCSDPVGLV